MTIQSSQTIADIVLEHSECAPIFQRHRIDFCCRGQVPLAEACADRGIDAEIVRGELEQAIAAAERRQRPPDVRSLSTEALINHVVTTHHQYLRRAFPLLRPLAAKVARVHGDHNPKLREIQAAVEELIDCFEPHLDEEEESLFPGMTTGRLSGRELEQEITSARTDHEAVGALLGRIRSASDDFALPEWACNSYRTLFVELERLERDTLQHVHLENHVLLPRFAV